MMSKHKTRDSGCDGIDRISDMPENVLCKILSCLPTNEAVAASILSTTWGSLFPSFFRIPPIVIDLDDTNHHYYNRTDHFTTFTDKLFHETLVNVPCLDSLKIRCLKYAQDNENIHTWVSMALRLNVRKLSLQICMDKPYSLDEKESKSLFDVLNGSTTLTSLELENPNGICNKMDFLDGFTLPNLKTLLLSQLGPELYMEPSSPVEEHNSLNRFINCFPALESLSLRRCQLGECLSIESSILENLVIENSADISVCVLRIAAPKLKVLQYIGHAPKSLTVAYIFKSLVSADIDVEFPWKVDGVDDFVTACSGTIRLSLSTNSIQALVRSGAKLPMFRNLSRLALGHIQRNSWVLLADLLYHSPNLEKLTFEQGLCLQEGGFLSFMSLLTSPPICMKHHLKEIEFWAFNETEDEIKLIEYFLNHGEAMQTIKLCCLPFTYNSTQQSTQRKLSMLPNHSKLLYQPKPTIESQQHDD